MKCTYELKPSCYYLFESLSSGRSCYFESEEEIIIFRKLFFRYMGSYIAVDSMYLGSEGYQILVKVREKSTIQSNYKKVREKRGRKIKEIFIKEPWRIISEQMRIFKSLYVKTVNRIRGRKGVLVQQRYSRYYFENKEEYEQYKKTMEAGKEIKSQEKDDYRVEKRWIKKVNWRVIRGKRWVESAMDRAFANLVVSNLVQLTLTLHNHNPHPNSIPIFT